MSERTVFINGIPALCEALDKAGRTEEWNNIVKNFLNQTFAKDIERKVERFRSLPTGIFLADTPYFKIFWEFNQVYIAGLYYTTVVTAGVLCERVCLDILEKHEFKPKKDACLGYLIKVTEENNFAKARSVLEMKKIQKKRNKYVHPEMKASDNQRDAFEMVKSIAIVLKNECVPT